MIFADTLEKRDDYKNIVLSAPTIIDVRAPIEFNKGSLPGAINMPLLSDAHREIIGTVFKEKGQNAAIETGLALIDEPARRAYIKEVKGVCDAHPDAIIMCFRGGKRSQIVQQWLYDFEGVKMPRIRGGFKAMRRFLIDALAPERMEIPLYLIAGHTGAGKTLLLKTLDNAVDLEGLANHRGSSFGGYALPQPTQIDFEHALAYKVLQLVDAGAPYIVAEKEGKLVGKNRVPENFWAWMQTAELVVLKATMEDRIKITFDDYITRDMAEFTRVYGEEGTVIWHDKRIQSIKNLEKRLGRERMQHALKLFEDAYNSGDVSQHRQWIEHLLNDYYDPMYDYQCANWVQEVVYEGDADMIRAYFASLV